MDKIKIYLAGPVHETEWRKKLIKDYSAQADFLDPAAIDSSDSSVVLENQHMIGQADFILAYNPGVDTSMEIMYAYTVHLVPVYVVAPRGRSLWLDEFAEGVYDNFMDAMGDIFDSISFSDKSCSGDCGRVVDAAGNQIHNANCPAFEVRVHPIENAKSPGIDVVNHPPHYTSGGIETKDFIRAKELGYNLGNAVKYIARCGKKAGSDPIEDLRKAVFYLNDEVTHMEKEINEAKSEAIRRIDGI